MRSLRRILVIEPYGIGDALFITPLLRSLRLIPTVESVDLVLGTRTEPVFRHNPHIDRIFCDRDKLPKTLRGYYDLLIDLALQRGYGFKAQFALRIPRRIGFNYKNRGMFLTQSIPLPQGFVESHVIDYFCELGKILGLEIEERFPEFYLSEEDYQKAAEILQRRGGFQTRPYLAIAPGGGESWGKDASFKRWPASFFAEIIPLVGKRVDFEGVFILGSEGEKSLGEEIVQHTKSDPACRPYQILNLCGELPIGAAAALLEKAVLFLANDGGLVHIAHALRVPLVAFYGPTDPVVYGPYPKTPEAVAVFQKDFPCRPCYVNFRYNTACADRECLTGLFPEEVVKFLDRKNFWEARTTVLNAK